MSKGPSFVISQALTRRLHTWAAPSPSAGSHQILGVEGNLIPPRGHELVVAGENAAVHVLVPSWVEEGLEATEPARRKEVSRLLVVG